MHYNGKEYEMKPTFAPTRDLFYGVPQPVEKYILKRGHGKTTQMVKMACTNSGLMIVANDTCKTIAKAREKELGLADLNVVSVDDIVRRGVLQGIDKKTLDHVYVDEAITVLVNLLPQCHVAAVTLSEWE
jgi:hypothetical protein